MMKLSLRILFSLLLALPVLAKTSLNSVCYLENAADSSIQGERTQELFEIASVSKVFVTYWALSRLGAQHRFATGVHVTPIGTGQADVHIEGSLDPFFGRQSTHFLVSELARLGVTQVRQWSFDENFKLRWAVRTAHEQPLNPPPEEIAAGLLAHFKTLAREYPQTAQDAVKAGMALAPNGARLKVGTVSFVAKADFHKAAQTVSYSLKSAPLYRYLKEMNVVSNNHVADKLYEYLGGAAQFQNFFKQSLNLDSRQLQFINGSGNSVIVGQDPSGRPIKQYNKSTCESLIQVLLALQNELVSKQNLDLTDVLAVSKTDQGTMSPRYDGMPNTVVAKTGTVDPAVTMTGVISTAQGNIYYGVLMKTDGISDWENARDQIRAKVYQLMGRFGGARPFDYQASYFMPIDHESQFAGAAMLPLTRP